MNQVRTLHAVIEEGLDKYAGVFVPGGQAPVVDLMQDPQTGEILRHFHALGAFDDIATKAVRTRQRVPECMSAALSNSVNGKQRVRWAS
jgi:hypothetical protein